MTRWRDRPRRTLRRWDLDKAYGLYAIALVAAWVIGIEYAIDAVLGRTDAAGSDWRPGTALYAVVALAVAGGLTWLLVAYLKRPLRPEDERPPADLRVPDDVRVRNDAERSAREHRTGPGF